MRILRKATGPWSPWNISGPVAASLPVMPEGVGPFISTFSWITWPLSVTLANLALAVFFSPSNLGALNSMTIFCHSPGALAAFVLGAAAPYRGRCLPIGVTTFSSASKAPAKTNRQNTPANHDWADREQRLSDMTTPQREIHDG